jgi:hypothetical protein
MEIQKDKMVVLNEDDKAVSMKELSDLFFAAKQMHDWIKEDALTEEMKDTLFSLIESHTAHAAKTLGYDSNAAREIDKRFTDIRKANQTIHELEKKLADNSPVSGLKELLYAMHSALYKWWGLQGFNLVTDDEFGGYGYKGRFCLSLHHISFMSRKPVTDKLEKKNRLEQMIEEGYELVEEDKEYTLLDTPVNRAKITAIVKSKFPSMDIFKWNNWCLHKKEGFQLRDFEAYIRDLSDLKALMDEMNNVKDDEDE